jgi:capsular polysaccharide biosynthesis protein
MYFLVLRPVIAVLGCFDRSFSIANDLPHPIRVEGGTWWYGQKYLPYSGKNLHTYFSALRDGEMLRQSLVQSGGSCAFLTSAHFRAAILQISEAGLRIISSDRASDRELSSGAWLAPSGEVRVRDGIVAIQRNSKNYHHFTMEVLPSIVAWEASLPDNSILITAEASFVEPLMRLINFRGAVIQLKSPSIALAKNVNIIRLLPAGYYHRGILRQIADRAHLNATCSSIPSRSVVFLLRSEYETRRLGNEADAIGIIMDAFPEVDIFYPGDASVDEQVARMAKARIVIATHGAHASNIIWAVMIKHFIEISYFGERKPCFQELAKLLGASARMVRSTARVNGDDYSVHDCDLTELKGVMTFLRKLWINGV